MPRTYGARGSINTVTCIFGTAKPIDHVLFLAVALNHMRITFDPAKNNRNIAEPGLSFDRVADLDRDKVIAMEDTRKDHGERRPRVLAPRMSSAFAKPMTRR